MNLMTKANIRCSK